MNQFSKVFLAIALVIALLALPAAVSAENVRPGSHYSGIEIWQENRTAYGMPPLEQNEIDSQTTFLLDVFINTRGCIDERVRDIKIVPYDSDPVIDAKLGVNGVYSTRLPVGTYDIVLMADHGSDPNQPNTYRMTSKTIEGKASGRYEVSFIGAGQSCGSPPDPVPEKIDDATARGHLEHVHIIWWVWVDGIHLQIVNPNDVTVHVDIIATLTGQQPFHPWNPKVITYNRGYDVNPGMNNRMITVNELFLGTPSLTISSTTTSL